MAASCNNGTRVNVLTPEEVESTREMVTHSGSYAYVYKQEVDGLCDSHEALRAALAEAEERLRSVEDTLGEAIGTDPSYRADAVVQMAELARDRLQYVEESHRMACEEAEKRGSERDTARAKLARACEALRSLRPLLASFQPRPHEVDRAEEIVESTLNEVADTQEVQP